MNESLMLLLSSLEVKPGIALASSVATNVMSVWPKWFFALEVSTFVVVIRLEHR